MAPFEQVNPEHVEALCPGLRELLHAELAAGNRLCETWTGWPKENSVGVALALPFKLKPTTLPPGVEYLDVNDTHWWKAEYHHNRRGHLLICKFGDAYA